MYSRRLVGIGTCLVVLLVIAGSIGWNLWSSREQTKAAPVENVNPYIARLTFSARGGSGMWCTGWILEGGKKVVTAAHCLSPDESPGTLYDSVTVTPGGQLNENGQTIAPYGQCVRTTGDFRAHPGWTGGANNDIAVILGCDFSGVLGRVTGFPVLKVNELMPVQTAVYMIGYPWEVYPSSQQVTHGEVTSATATQYTTSLERSGGYSGAPVLNLQPFTFPKTGQSVPAHYVWAVHSRGIGGKSVEVPLNFQRASWLLSVK